MCLVAFLKAGLVAAQLSIPGSFTVKGKVSGMNDGYIYFYYPTEKRGITDSCRVMAGHFTWKGEIPEPVKVVISTATLDRLKDYSNYGEFYMEPGRGRIKLSIAVHHFKEVKISGSAIDKDRGRLSILKKTVDNEIKKTDSLLRTKMWLVKKDSLFDCLGLLFKESSGIDSVFIINNPVSFVSADLLFDRIRSGNKNFASLTRIYNDLPEKIKASYCGQGIRHELEKEKSISVGAYAKRFVSVSFKGDTVDLFQFRNRKYVLLDFWASWCIPCRRLTPGLARINTKYGAELEVISIAVSNTETEWRTAIEKDGMFWTQIRDDKEKAGSQLSGSISGLYHIGIIPDLILLDKDLKVVGEYDSSGVSAELLAKDLKQIFNF